MLNSVTRTGMSLLAVSPNMIGGLATYTRQLALALADRLGDAVVFFVGRDAIDHWRNVLPGGARLHPVLIGTQAATVRALFEVAYLPRLAAQQGCSGLFYPNVTAPLWAHPRPIVTLHDVMHLSQLHDTSWYKEAYLNYCYRRLRKAQAQVLTVSDFSRDDISRRTGIALEQITAIHSGVDERFFEAAPTTGDAPGEPYVLSVGACYPHKRLTSVVRVFERIAGHGALKLIMVGTDHGSAVERARLVSAIDRSPCCDRIVRLTKCSPDQLPALYRNATLLLHASLYEGFGFPIAEAMASRLPVAASPAGAVAELLNGQGALAADNSEESLTEAAASVFRWSSDERRAYGEAVRRRAEQSFRWSRVADRVAEVFP